MELDHIRILLRKYYNGESSLAEEKELKDFLSRDIVPDEFKNEQLHFQFLQQAGVETMPGEVILPDVEKQMVKQRTVRWPYYMTGAAACMALLIGTFYWYQLNENGQKANPTLAKGTCENPEEAYAEAKRALLIVSTKLNKGTDRMQKISKFHEVQSNLTARSE